MTLSQFLRIVEIRTKIVSLSTFSIAVLVTRYWTGSFDLLRLALMAVAVLLVDMGTTAFNIYYDYRRGVDRADFEREREKVLVYEGVAPGAAFLTATALFAGAGFFGLIIALLTGVEVLIAGGACMAVGYLYTGGPRPISRTPFGELFAGGFLGSALFLITWFVMAGYLPEYETLPSRALLGSLPSFFLIASILTVNNTCDIEGDREAGRRTFSIIFGKKAGEAAVYILGFLGFGTAICLGLTGGGPFVERGAFAASSTFVEGGVFSGGGVFPPLTSVLVAVAAVPAWLEYRTLHRRGFSQATKGPSMASISKILMLYTLAMWLSLGIAIAST